MINITRLVVTLAITLGAAFVGSLLTTPNITSWYAKLNKPTFNPPNWIFGPVWTILFILMGISLYLVWMKGFDTNEGKTALGLFGLQLVLNVVWSLLFFQMHSLSGALIEIAVLWLAILGTIISFMGISRVAGLLLVPYLLWVSFASFLTLTIYRLNH
jgi:translocator protein